LQQYARRIPPALSPQRLEKFALLDTHRGISKRI
jgi:hypothetical protein